MTEMTQIVVWYSARVHVLCTESPRRTRLGEVLGRSMSSVTTVRSVLQIDLFIQVKNPG